VDDSIAVALKFGFLAVLYLFLVWVARSALKDLRRHADTGVPGEHAPALSSSGRSAARSEGDLRAGVTPSLVVVAALGHEPGTAFEIGGGATLGRVDGADIRVDDPYASSAHARIFRRESFMYIEDMGSTNGTYLNGRQLRRPEQLKMHDTIRIGDTEYRYQE